MPGISVTELMDSSGVQFGTSGARGLAAEITDRVAYSYTLAFLNQQLKQGENFSAVAIGGDLRPSTERIMTACAVAVKDSGKKVINAGRVPSPALAGYGIKNACPTVMVTGSHIPEDRNGIKFTTSFGEITKADEKQIKDQVVELDEELFQSDGSLKRKMELPSENKEVLDEFMSRYLSVYAEDSLSGLRIGVYQHSAVGRDFLVELYRNLGAEVIELGRSDTFVPVDTEAIRAEDCQLALDWAAEHKLDSIVSTDGDSDRPLISDERGVWIRGDVSGIITAKILGAEAVSTPVSCNSALEKSNWFKQTIRTKIGSPFVIEGMQAALADGLKVVGYEANGGFLLGSSFNTLGELPTRDAVIVHLSLLTEAKRRKQPVSTLLNDLPARFTASDRIKDFAREKSLALIAQIKAESSNSDHSLFELCGEISSIDETDGLRIIFTSEDVVHLRPSGNAPELRCYAEAATEERAAELVSSTLRILAEN